MTETGAHLLILAGCVALLLTGCDDAPSTQAEEFRDYIKSHQISERGDYLLVRYTFGEPDPVALSFGFRDNLAFCEEIREMYVAKYPGERYVCQPAQ